MADLHLRAQSHRMLRRTIALGLWMYFAWYLGAMVAAAAGLPAIVGPIAAVAMAAFGLHDWRRARTLRSSTPVRKLHPSR